MATPIDGSDLKAQHYCGISIFNKVKNCFTGAVAPAAPATGCLWFDTNTDVLKVWNGSWWQDAALIYGVAPPGSIVVWNPGYYTDGSNGGYTNVLGAGNTVAQQNAYLNGYGWYICDGAAVNNASSPIWNAASRYLPNLTDDRFIMGDTAAGTPGGANTMVHTHQCDPPSTPTGGPSATTLGGYYYEPFWDVPTGTHTHSVNVAEFASGAASDTENRPVYLGCYYAIRVF